MSDYKICFQKFPVLPDGENLLGTYSHDTATVNVNLLTILKVKLTSGIVDGTS